MRCKFWAASLFLALTGCYLDQPSSAPVYGYSPDYPPGYYPAPDYPPPAAYPGYDYNAGAPTIVEGGAAVPLVFYGGEWGYYDHRRHWHRAPDPVYRDLERRRYGDPRFYPGAVPPGRPPGNRPPPQVPPPPPQQHPFFGGSGPAGFHPSPPPPAPPPPPARPFFGGGGGGPPPPAPPPAPRPAPPPAAPPSQAHPFFGN